MDIDIAYVYQLLFKVTNKFLEMANKFGIHELQNKHNPTIEEIATDATDLSRIMNQIADEKWDDERLAMNAAQAAHFMRNIAIAVRNGNEEVFSRSLRDLENHELV